jgi:hypothetical protein
MSAWAAAQRVPLRIAEREGTTMHTAHLRPRSTAHVLLFASLVALGALVASLALATQAQAGPPAGKGKDRPEATLSAEEVVTTAAVTSDVFTHAVQIDGAGFNKRGVIQITIHSTDGSNGINSVFAYPDADGGFSITAMLPDGEWRLDAYQYKRGWNYVTSTTIALGS